jgi:hypothetical protein
VILHDCLLLLQCCSYALPASCDPANCDLLCTTMYTPSNRPQSTATHNRPRSTGGRVPIDRGQFCHRRLRSTAVDLHSTVVDWRSTVVDRDRLYGRLYGRPRSTAVVLQSALSCLHRANCTRSKSRICVAHCLVEVSKSSQECSTLTPFDPQLCSIERRILQYTAIEAYKNCNSSSC